MLSNIKLQHDNPDTVSGTVSGLDESTRKIGSTIGAVNKMIINGDEMKVLMPTILGKDPKSISSGWDDVVKDYWDSLRVEIEEEGMELEVGFIYDFNDREKREEITRLALEFKSIVDDKSLMKVLKDSKDGKQIIPENKKYLYATPINIPNYLLWRYCLNYSLVANKIEDVDKSPRIAFYLYSKGEIESTRREASKLEDKSLAKYIELISKEEKVDNVILALGHDIKGMSVDDKHILLKNLSKEDATKFIETVDDKNLIIKAEINKLINANILRRTPNTEIITDASDPELILGHSINEVITYFSLDTKQAKVSEYRVKFKALNK
jgi:hypothetical protein